jgi:hypothetical protein
MTTFGDSPAVLLPTHPEQHSHDDGGAARGAPGARPAPGSPLHGDDLAAAPFEMSAYCHGQLERARDLLGSWLPAIAVGDERARPAAAEPTGLATTGLGTTGLEATGLAPQIWAATLLDALAAAAIAVWVLSPEERAVRVTHRLDVALRQYLDIARIQRYAGVPTQQADEDVRRVIDVACELGLRVTGSLPIRPMLEAASGHSTARSRLPSVYALLRAAADGDADAVESLCRIPVRLPGSSSPEKFAASPELGFRVALAAITSVVLYGEALYDAGRVEPR